MASIGEVDERDVLNPQDLEDLYNWIDAAPLTRPKKNIARDFSDGVSVAEIVHFYMPRMVELHNYVNANSTPQKRINWNMLNRKVFVKLNLKLNEKIVENVIEAKPGAIEQVLSDLRKKIIELNPKSKSLIRTNTASQLRGRNSSTGYSEAKIVKRTPTGLAIPQASRIPKKASLLSTTTFPQNVPKITRAFLPSPNITSGLATEKVPSRSPRGGAESISYTTGLRNELTQFDTNVASNPPPPPPPEPERERVSERAPVTSSPTPGVDLNANESASLPPAHLIYKGHKMVPSMLLDIKNKQIRDMEAVVNSLQKKVNFLDNLIQLKDNRVEDLTRQLHGLRSKFQELTQANIPDL